jgi:hypothetical protein
MDTPCHTDLLSLLILLLLIKGYAPEEAKMTSVKKLLLIAVVPDMQENYENVKLIWDKLNMENVRFYVATDLKLANLMFGLQSHSMCIKS